MKQIQHDCRAFDVAIDDVMLLWTPIEARAYFSSGGGERPHPDVLATRNVSDRAPRPGLRQHEQEVFIGCCCPCCDTLIVVCLDSMRKRRAEQQLPDKDPFSRPQDVVTMERH